MNNHDEMMVMTPGPDVKYPPIDERVKKIQDRKIKRIRKILSHIDQGNYITKRNLMDLCGMSRRKVQETLDALIERDVLEESKFHGSIIYRRKP